jgi:hypothetical protein
MPSLIHFLLVYSYGEERLLAKDEFTNAADASAAYRKAEEDYRGRSDEFEIVLVGADSLDTIRKTHGHYFLAPAEHRGFADLLA